MVHYHQANAGAADGASFAVDVLAAVSVLAECSSQLEHEPLKSDMGNATATLVGHIEGQCRDLVRALLVSASGSAAESGEIAYDKLWTLRSMCKKSDVTCRWIMECGGTQAVAQVLMAYPEHGTLHKEGAWLCYTLRGTEGFGELLKHTKTCLPVQQAIAWAIATLAQKQQDRGQAGAAEWPHGEVLVSLLLEALRAQQASLDLRWACCSALQLLVQAQPCRGTLFVSQGGAEAALAALAAGQAAGAEGSKVLVASMHLITSLVDGNAAVAQELRSLGALDALVTCGMNHPGRVNKQSMWTLGQVGGMLPVLQVMSKAPDDSPAVMSGLVTIAKLAWLPPEESLQQQFPHAAEALLNLALRVDMSGDVAEKVLQGLGGVLNVLSPHISPGAWPVMDRGVSLLIDATGPSSSAMTAQAAVASLGHIAANAPAWRAPLKRALGGIRERLRKMEAVEDEVMKCARQQKLFSWASAVIAGLPVVLEQMQDQAASSRVQVAGLSAILDVLDSDADGQEGGLVDPAHVPAAIAVVASAMRGHSMQEQVQWLGCRALGLMHQLLPGDDHTPPEALEGVLAAMRRHPKSYKVTSAACAAIRGFLEPRRGRDCDAARAVTGRMVEVLRLRDMGSTFHRMFRVWSTTNDKELLEDSFYALGLVEGLTAILQVLAECEDVANAALRSAALQAMFELVRTFPHLLASQQLAQSVHAVARNIVAQSVEADAAAADAATAQGDASRCRTGELQGFASVDGVEIARRGELLLGVLQAGVAAQAGG